MSAITASCVGAPRRLGTPEAAVLIVIIVLAGVLAARSGTATQAPDILGLLCGSGLAGALVLRCSVSMTLGQLLRPASTLVSPAQG
ncbi:hypothetical protein AB0K71_28985 [Streptomyces syringium]|uniref:hypothetical protein n=1 Tax=Streptomyces syringium TaxID=76729 RepID=UPI0034324DF0